jgi:hypothetical protein
MVGLVPTIQPSASSELVELDPRDKPEDDKRASKGKTLSAPRCRRRGDFSGEVVVLASMPSPSA